ncbi:MAG: ParB/RepB/Spo0J family partition protein [Methylobacter sp.]|nr:ParB/RepB/Spo0J family partition protein [Methylobacter sp.]
MTIATKNKTEKTTKPLISGLGLDSMGDLSALLDAPATAVNSGGPRQLDIELIDEDPKQPRTANNPGFTDDSLNELSASIKLRGVKTPISVRNNPNALGRFIINHGARRFRGSKRAGLSTIPGFIDNDYNEADQVVENLQRNELTAREIADFIGRELAKGVKKIEIAKAISKSPAFVTQHITLLDLPDPIAEAFNSGQVKDVTVVNELVTAYKKRPQEVSDWLDDDGQEITRGSVKLLREFLDDKSRHEVSDEDVIDSDGGHEGVEKNEGGNVSKEKEERPTDPDKLKKAIVQVKHDGRSARLILNRRPQTEGFAWLKYDDDGYEFGANLADVQLVAVLEA